MRDARVELADAITSFSQATIVLRGRNRRDAQLALVLEEGRTTAVRDDDAGQCGFDDKVEHGLAIVPAVQERQSQRGTHRYDCESRPNPSHAAHFSPIGPFVDSAPGEAFN